MSESFALGSFLARWAPSVRHDLTASDSETLTLTSLLQAAGPEDLERWRDLGFGYVDPRGAPWLRSAVAARYATLDPDDVLCCAGAQEALVSVAGALLTPDDHAVVVLPIYQPSEQAVSAHCAVSGVPLTDAGGWRLDVDRVAAALRPNTKLVLTNFPNSPTGASIDAETLGDLVALCRRYGLWLMNDEVYQKTVCDMPGPPLALADLYERGISINSLSKGFGLPGLRIGWVGCRDRAVLARTLNVKSILSSCLASASEVLAHIALKAETSIIERSRAIGQRNRAELQGLFDRHPDVFEADRRGNLAFAFPRHRGPEGADHFAARLARDAGLLVLPSGLWRSRLAEIPMNHLRIGLGHIRAGAALAALEEQLF